MRVLDPLLARGLMPCIEAVVENPTGLHLLEVRGCSAPLPWKSVGVRWCSEPAAALSRLDCIVVHSLQPPVENIGLICLLYSLNRKHVIHMGNDG